jgi:hypothetical protein
MSEKKPPIRYNMMRLLVEKNPLSAEEFAQIVKQHQEFIASGGGGGRWQTFVTPGDTETGVVLGVYTDQPNKDTAGAQAQLEYKRLDGLDLRGIALPYANLCGVSCREQDLRGANLEGSLITDSDFSGSNFQKANLRSADFSRADLMNCDFRDADLSNTDFENADLTGSDMRGASIVGARFTNAVMDGVLQ